MSGLMIYSLGLDRMGVFYSWGWWWFCCCLCSNRSRGGWSHRSLSWHHKKNTQQGTWGLIRRVEVSEPVRWESGGGDLGLVSTTIGWRLHGGHTCERQRLRTLAATWKLHLWGKAGGGGVRLHVNQALYKFSLCLLEELNRRTPLTRAPGKKRQVLPGQQEDSWRSSNWLVLFRGLSTTASTGEGRLFSSSPPLQRSTVLQREQERGRPANGAARALIQCCLLSWVYGSATTPGKKDGVNSQTWSLLCLRSPSLRLELSSRPVE